MNGSKHILLVDDEPSVRSATSLMLNLDGHAVTVASSGAEALGLFSEGQFDLVITDFAMSDMNGDELVIRLKKLSPRTPAVMITGHDKRFGSADNPVDAILFKPYRLEDLRSAIAKVLSSVEERK
jgi:two-component system, cell cycle sensor histidine kinase and response regulator CckA